MDMLSSVVSGFVVELGKYVCKCIYPKIENTVHFSANLEILRTEMEKLTKFRDDIKGKVEGDEGKGYKPKPDVLKWIEDVRELENEWESMQESIAAAKMLTYKCCPNCSLRSEISTQARNIRDQLCRLKEVGESFGSNLVVENYQVKKVEYIPVSSIKGQPAAIRNLNKILQHLEDDKLLDCDNTRLHCLPQGMDKLTNLRLLNLPVNDFEESISQGFFLKLPRIEMLNMLPSKIRYFFPGRKRIMRKKRVTLVGPTSLDEISSLHNLTSLFVNLDSSSVFNRDHTWMKRLKRFHIEIGDTRMETPFYISNNKSTRILRVSNCEIFSNGELSGMLQFASHLHLIDCMGLRQLIACNSFDGLKSLYIDKCFCNFRPSEEGSGQFDPLPNVEYLNLNCLGYLKNVSDFGQLLGLRFSKLRLLNIRACHSLTCLFNVEEAFSVPKHLEEITIDFCLELVELFVQCSSSQKTVVTSEIRKLVLQELPKLETFGESQSMWEHLEELEAIKCNGLRKLPLSIQTSNNVKVIRGTSEWWSQLEWDDDNFKSNLEHCFTESYW